MYRAVLSMFSIVAVLAAATPMAAAQEGGRYGLGGDTYIAGQSAAVAEPVSHDAFAAGYDVAVGGAVAGDAHLAGYNVNVRAPVTGDVYALGFAINVAAAVAGDLTAFGNMVTVASTAPVTGNLRAGGASLVIDAPVAGSALISAQNATLNAPVEGDLTFVGEALSFGPAASVRGRLDLRGPREIVVPESVAPADRVAFSIIAAPDYAAEAGRTAEHVVRGIWPAVWATGLWWLLLLAVGALFIAGAPRLVADLELAAERRTFRNLGLGLLSFSAVVGLLPVAAVTVIGLVLLPFLAIFVVVICALAYLAGAYLAFGRVARAFLPIDNNLKRLGLLAVAVVVGGLLGMIPFVGWLLTLAILVYGFGAMTLRTMVRWSAGDAARLAPAVPA